jgi:hypothetical protein
MSLFEYTSSRRKERRREMKGEKVTTTERTAATTQLRTQEGTKQNKSMER